MNVMVWKEQGRFEIGEQYIKKEQFAAEELDENRRGEAP